MSEGIQEELDFVGEEKELYTKCSREAAVTFKFFSLFKVETSKDSDTATVYFGEGCIDRNVSIPVGKEIKSYVKTVKKMIIDNPKGIHQAILRRKMFWLVTKLLEHGVFGPQFARINNYLFYVWDETKDD
jgi:hypothetical protein